MRFPAFSGLWLIGAALSGVAAPAAAQTLLWSDEFNGTSLNTADWEYMIGDGTAYGNPGWGNNELQYYTDRPENVQVGGGLLRIIARRENYEGKQYTSARLRSLNKRDFKYGRMEARIKLPSGTGIWPAFWMLPTGSPYGGWAASGEIDIVESVNTATTIYGTIHHGGQWPGNTHTGGTYSPGMNFGDDFHVYRIDWNPDTIDWYVDDILYFQTNSNVWFSTAAPENNRAPFDQFFHFLLNVAVGGNFPGPPNAGTPFPLEMQVDWVRVSDIVPNLQTPFGGAARAIPGRVEAEDYDNGGQGIAYNDCDQPNQGGQYRVNHWVDLETSSESGFNIGYMCAGEWTEYTVDVAAAGLYRVQARVASQATGGSFHLESDETPISSSIAVPVTGGWQNWQTVSALVELPEGLTVLRFTNDSGSQEYNVNWFDFAAIDAADLDLDGDVDGADGLALCGCLNGPDVSSPPAGCTAGVFERADQDGDSDVDSADLSLMLVALQ